MANENIDITALKESQKAELVSLRNEHKAQLKELQDSQKADLLDAKAQGMSKEQIHKLKNDQWIAYSQYLQDLQYDEYLLEQSHKKALDDANGVVVDESKDADKEQGAAIVIWFRHLIRNIKVSLSEKPSIIFGLLSCVGGLLIGFEINKYIVAANGFPSGEGLPGIYVFVLMMAGMLDAVCGIQMCGERRLKSAISSSICAVIILVFGILWISALGADNYTSTSESGTSIIITIIIMVCSVAGAIGNMFTYNKHYVKPRR